MLESGAAMPPDDDMRNRTVASRTVRLIAAVALSLMCAGAAPSSQQVVSGIGAERISANLRTLASVPRLAGTPADRRMADWVAGQLRDAGLEVEIAEYQVWLPYPVSI